MPGSKTVVANRQIAALLKELRTLQTAVTQISALQPVVIALADSLALGQAVSAMPVTKSPTYLREWRESRRKSLNDVAKVVGLSKGQLSRVENGHQPYNQRILEAYAEVFGCWPSDLLTHPPFRPEPALQPLFRHVRAARSRQGIVA